MAILKVARLGHPAVRTAARPVPRESLGTAEMAKLIEDMRETLHEYDGVGLAAPQVHLGLRLAVIEVGASDRRSKDGVPFMVLVNPRIEPLSPAKVSDWEGCLSVPGLRGTVPRYSALRLEAWDERGHPYTLEARDFFARVIQHECDHLDGKVYLDRMEGLESLCFLREFERYRSGDTDED
jgi:peptide deformylase